MREPHRRDEPTAYRDPGPTMIAAGSNAAVVRVIDSMLDQVNAIARIIDPNCFWDEEPPNEHQERKCERARIKARAILAYLLK